MLYLVSMQNRYLLHKVIVLRPFLSIIGSAGTKFTLNCMIATFAKWEYVGNTVLTFNLTSSLKHVLLSNKINK